MPIQQSVSEAIAHLRFPLTVFIVMYHCYCVMPAHNQPLYAAIVYPFGLTMGETGVPAFFFISGYLFYVSQRSYLSKLKSRASSLLVPYVIWNGLVLLAYIILMILGRSLDIADKNISNFNLLDYIRAFIDRGQWANGNGQPLLCPLWYIRNLIILSLGAPLIKYMMTGVKSVLFLFFLSLWWISLPYNGMIAQSLLFFSMGIFFSVNNISPILSFDKTRISIIVFLWLLLLILDLLAHFYITIWGGLYIHRLVLIFNIFILFLLSAIVLKHIKVSPILEKSCFWIYAFHYPFTLLLRSKSYEFNDWEQFAFYWLSVIAILTICIVTYVIGLRTIPRIMNILTGNR